jgi:hypothetical protein
MYTIFRVLIIAAILSSASVGWQREAYSAVQPEYAKWGQIAMQQTSAKYHASIVDYLHVGRTQAAPGITEEKFKLWLRENSREFGVYVTIRFYTATEQIITIRYQETPN